MKALLGALLCCAFSVHARAQAPTQDKIPPIQEQGDFYILNFSENPADQLILLDFVKLAQEATGFNFTYDPQTGTALAQVKLGMLGTKRIPKAEFYDFFQIQLFINGFVCQVVERVLLEQPPVRRISQVLQEQGDSYVLNLSENPDEQPSLLDLVKLAQKPTGFHFTYDPQTGTALSQAKLVMLGTNRIPKSELYNFLQIQLFINDFVCLEVGPPQISLILIQSLP